MRVKEIFRRFSKRARSPLPNDAAGSSSLVEIPPPLVITRIRSYEEFQEYRAQMNAELAARQEEERELAQRVRLLLRLGFVSCARNAAIFELLGIGFQYGRSFGDELARAHAVPTMPAEQQNAGQHSFVYGRYRSDKRIPDLCDGAIKPAV